MNKGFTLIELGIVILIISTLSVIVLGGRSLITSSKVGNVIAKMSEIDTSIKSISIEYNNLPGDLNLNDENYFPSYSGEPVCADQHSGDGDGKIESSGETDAAAIEDSTCEELILWGHLKEAELYPHAEGVGFSIGGDMTKSPLSSISQSYYEVGYEELGGANDNYIRLGSLHSDDLKGAALVSKNARSIDKKVDDGVPNTGRLISQDGADVSSGDCFSGNSYNLINKQTACTIYNLLDIMG